MAGFCHFFGVGLSEVKGMTVLEFEAFDRYRRNYLDALQKAAKAKPGRR